MKPWMLATLVAVYWLLHQDFWFWRDTRPLLFGFLPIGLVYHGVYTLGVSLLMLVVVKYAWPSQLEREVDRSDD